MKFVAIADQHGILRDLPKPADTLLIAGDVVPLRFQCYSKDSKKWFKEKFIPWATEQPVHTVVMVAGNHDFWLERHGDEFEEMCKGTNILYLENELIFIKPKESDNRVYGIYGTPLCKPFGNWAFMKELEYQRKVFEEGLKRVNEQREIRSPHNEIKTILLSHDAPYGVSDIIQQKSCSWYDGKSHIGNKALAEFITEMKPDINIHGHLHTTNHDPEMLAETEVRCVSVLNEDYDLAYEPTYFEL